MSSFSSITCAPAHAARSCGPEGQQRDAEPAAQRAARCLRRGRRAHADTARARGAERTCLRMLMARDSASRKVSSLWNCSCSWVCAPSEPAPMALASKRVKVPDGSVWYSTGPRWSQPAIKSATPNGRDMAFSSPDSPNCSARSHTACVSDSTGIG
eukprot:5314197-Prymnesium_polylepis.1